MKKDNFNEKVKDINVRNIIRIFVDKTKFEPINRLELKCKDIPIDKIREKCKNVEFETAKSELLKEQEDIESRKFEH